MWCIAFLAFFASDGCPAWRKLFSNIMWKDIHMVLLTVSFIKFVHRSCVTGGKIICKVCGFWTTSWKPFRGRGRMVKDLLSQTFRLFLRSCIGFVILFLTKMWFEREEYRLMNVVTQSAWQLSGCPGREWRWYFQPEEGIWVSKYHVLSAIRLRKSLETHKNAWQHRCSRATIDPMHGLSSCYDSWRISSSNGRQPCMCVKWT